MRAKIKEWVGKALELLDRILAVLRVKLAFCKPYSPSFAPSNWIYINGTCCMSTAMFFLLGLLHEKSSGYEFAEIFYIPFNLVICLVWFVEASLWIIFDEEEPAWHKIGELGLSAFFILDGIIWVYEWLFTETELERRAILIYTAIDFVIYLFYLFLAIRAEAKAAKKQLAEAGQETSDVEGGVVPPSDQKESKTGFKLMT